MKQLGFSLLAASLVALAWSPRADAGVEACGNIYVEAGAQCEVVPPGVECETQCTPISVQASCAAELYVGCAGECSAEASVECTGSCQSSCEAECEADPGSFECEGSCEATCVGECDAACAGAADGAQCQASCEASCSASCDAECSGVAPSASCEGKCSASCEGSCDAEANLDCQIACQSSGYADCVVDVQGGCESACSQSEGALFCDGQYIDHGGSLEECVLALINDLGINVEGYGDVECDENGCTAEAGGSAGCAVAADPKRAAGFGLLLLGALIAVRGRRRQ